MRNDCASANKLLSQKKYQKSQEKWSWISQIKCVGIKSEMKYCCKLLLGDSDFKFMRFLSSSSNFSFNFLNVLEFGLLV
jgi:hypothetical protein